MSKNTPQIMGINEELLNAINNALSIANEINYSDTSRQQAYEKIGRIVCQCIENWGYKVSKTSTAQNRGITSKRG